MVVLTQNRHTGHAGIVGLHIGDVNVKEYFPPEVQMVELELDHLCIVCPLEPSFWHGQPEIHDLRLSCWLEAKRNSGKLSAQPAPVAMIPCGKHSFRLQIISRDESDHAAMEPPKMLAVPRPTSLAAVVPAMDQRRYDRGHHPERRRVARLKGNESPSSAANH